MPIINTIRVIDNNSIVRQVCVVDEQPFYCSSGTSTEPKLRDIWLPFKGFGETIGGATGMFHKPDIASNSRGRIKNHFEDASIALALELNCGKAPLKWGRFQDTESLLTTCRLSRTRMQEEFPTVVNAVEKEYEKMEHWDALTLVDSEPDAPPLALNEDTMHDLNDRLKSMGARLDPDMERDYNPAADLKPDGFEENQENEEEYRDSLDEDEIEDRDSAAAMSAVSHSEQAQPKANKTSVYRSLLSYITGTPRTQSATSNTTAETAKQPTADQKDSTSSSTQRKIN